MQLLLKIFWMTCRRGATQLLQILYLTEGKVVWIVYFEQQDMVCWNTKHRYFDKVVLAEFRHLSSYFKILAWANLHWCQNCLNHKLLQQEIVCWHTCTKHRYFEKFVLAEFRHLSSYFKILAWANLHWCQNCLNHKLLQQEMVCWHTKHRYFEKCVLAEFRHLSSYFKILAWAKLALMSKLFKS